MKWVYYPNYNGGFIGSEEGHTQVCDFREGMGDRFGHIIADALNKASLKTVTVKDLLKDNPYDPKQLYAKVRKEFLLEHPTCEVCPLLSGIHEVTTHPATVIHHKRGRGPFLCDKTTFIASCSDGDSWIHRNKTRAKQLGLLVTNE